MYSQAVTDFTELMTLNPEATAVYLDERGLTYQYSGDFAHALVDFTDAISYDPMDDGVYYSRGTLLILMDQNAAAVADLQQVVTLNPAFANAFQMLGFAYTRESKLTRAAITYMEYLRLSSNLPDAECNRFGPLAGAMVDKKEKREYSSVQRMVPFGIVRDAGSLRVP